MEIPEIKVHKLQVHNGKWVRYIATCGEIREGVIESIVRDVDGKDRLLVCQQVKGWRTGAEGIAPQQLIGFIEEPDYS